MTSQLVLVGRQVAIASLPSKLLTLSLGILIGALLMAALSFNYADKVITGLNNSDSEYIIAAFRYGCVLDNPDPKCCVPKVKEFRSQTENIRRLD